VKNDYSKNWFWIINESYLKQINPNFDFKIFVGFKIQTTTQLHYVLGIRESQKGRATNGSRKEGVKVS
jgi:hypothetical protein